VIVPLIIILVAVVVFVIAGTMWAEARFTAAVKWKYMLIGYRRPAPLRVQLVMFIVVLLTVLLVAVTVGSRF